MEHKIKIPEGCQVVVSRVGGMAVIEIAKEEPKFKENDIVYTEHVGYGRVSILKNSDFSKSSSNGDMFADSKVTMHIKTNFSLTKNENSCFSYMRLATDPEKQLLFDKLKEKCLMFDGKDIVRWRAKDMADYYIVYPTGEVGCTQDYGDEGEKMINEAGNYFPTEELAEQFQKQYLELLDKFHKNL